MKPRWHWSLFYLFLFMIVTGIIAWTKSPTIAVLLSAFETNRYIVPIIVKRNTRFLGILVLICCVPILAGMYYLIDLLLSPHLHTVMYRIQDALLTSLIGMAGGFVTTFWKPATEIRLRKKQKETDEYTRD